MHQNAAQSLNRESYTELIGYIKDESRQSFRYLNIADGLANTLLIRAIKDSVAEQFTDQRQEYIGSAYQKAIEDLFEYYHKICLHYSLSKTQDPELSADISQEAIYLLLASKNYIQDVNTWLRQVTHNLLCEHYRSKSEQKELYASLCSEDEMIKELMCPQNTLEIEGLEPAIKAEILKTQEYKEYESMASFRKIGDFAAHLKVSNAVAQKRKAKIIKNLRSRILLAIGWESGREILNYLAKLGLPRLTCGWLVANL